MTAFHSVEDVFAFDKGLRAILAAEKGDNTLLGARLAAGICTPMEQVYIWDNGFKPPPRGRRKRLRIAALHESANVARKIIITSRGYRRGYVKSAMEDMCRKPGIKPSTVKKHIKVAKRIWGGQWWKYNIKMARKGKLDKLY
jgi:hypothetical protein